MPHLSPMNWIITPLIMLSILLMMMTIIWWQFMPKFPSTQLTTKSSVMMKSWRWW